MQDVYGYLRDGLMGMVDDLLIQRRAEDPEYQSLSRRLEECAEKMQAAVEANDALAVLDLHHEYDNIQVDMASHDHEYIVQFLVNNF